MDPDDAADLLGELPPEQAERLLQLMEPDEAEDLRRLLSYGELTAGGMMTPEPVMLLARRHGRRGPGPRPQPRALALAGRPGVRRAAPPLETPTGQVPRRRALPAAAARAARRRWSRRVIDTSLEPVGPQAPLSTVTRYFATYNLVALPVVDEHDRLLGAVTVDDVIDHMLPEDWRDLDSEPDDADEED